MCPEFMGALTVIIRINKTILLFVWLGGKLRIQAGTLLLKPSNKLKGIYVSSSIIAGGWKVIMLSLKLVPFLVPLWTWLWGE